MSLPGPPSARTATPKVAEDSPAGPVLDGGAGGNGPRRRLGAAALPRTWPTNALGYAEAVDALWRNR